MENLSKIVNYLLNSSNIFSEDEFSELVDNFKNEIDSFDLAQLSQSQIYLKDVIKLAIKNAKESIVIDQLNNIFHVLGNKMAELLKSMNDEENKQNVDKCFKMFLKNSESEYNASQFFNAYYYLVKYQLSCNQIIETEKNALSVQYFYSAIFNEITEYMYEKIKTFGEDEKDKLNAYLLCSFNEERTNNISLKLDLLSNENFETNNMSNDEKQELNRKIDRLNYLNMLSDLDLNVYDHFYLDRLYDSKFNSAYKNIR